MQCYTKIADCLNIARKLNLSSEEAGRKARYDTFSETALNLHSTERIPKNKIAIALAHNANDQCETILFRLIRGSGTDGLSGIAYKRFDDNGFAVIRPILDLTRNEIEKYCRKDVELTRDLYLRGLKDGFLLFTSKAGQKARVPVDFKP